MFFLVSLKLEEVSECKHWFYNIISLYIVEPPESIVNHKIILHTVPHSGAEDMDHMVKS